MSRSRSLPVENTSIRTAAEKHCGKQLAAGIPMELLGHKADADGTIYFPHHPMLAFMAPGAWRRKDASERKCCLTDMFV